MTTPARIATAVSLVLVATLGIAWAAGVRIFVIQPIGALPDGVTAVVMGTPKLRTIDSPDAFCLREVGSVTLLCRAMVAGKVAENSRILLRLPYSATLYAWSGAPETEN